MFSKAFFWQVLLKAAKVVFQIHLQDSGPAAPMALPCAMPYIGVPSGTGLGSCLFPPLFVFIVVKKLMSSETQKTVGNFFVVFINPDKQNTYVRKVFLC